MKGQTDERWTMAAKMKVMMRAAVSDVVVGGQGTETKMKTVRGARTEDDHRIEDSTGKEQEWSLGVKYIVEVNNKTTRRRGASHIRITN